MPAKGESPVKLWEKVGGAEVEKVYVVRVGERREKWKEREGRRGGECN